MPTAPRPERAGRGEPGRAKQPGKPRWGRRIGLVVLLLSVLLVVWIVASYLSFRKGVEQANARLPKTVAASLAAQDGLLTSKPSLIMLLGTDGDKTAAREDFRRSDSILLVRTDPERHRMAYLSIPRDLRVEIPGQGTNKINAAFQLGGPALTMKTVRALTGLQPNHVVLVDFDNFKDVIDALGGVEIDVPQADPLQPFRLPLRDRGPLPGVAGLAVREGHADDGRQAGADLLARPREPARPGRERPHPRRAAAGCRRGDDRRARLLRDVPEAAVHRRRPRRAADDRPLRGPAAPARLDAVPLERGIARCTAASAASRSRSAASPCSSAARRTASRSRCSPASRRRSRRRRGRRSAPAAGSAAACESRSCLFGSEATLQGSRRETSAPPTNNRVDAWGSSAGSSSGCSRVRSRGR